MSKFFFRENKGGTENRYFPYHRHKNTSTYVTQKNIDVGSEKKHRRRVQSVKLLVQVYKFIHDMTLVCASLC